MMEAKKRETNDVILSVVVATYNGAEYIEKCLESFTRQSIDNNQFEVIVVNNNSTDDTARIAGEFTCKYDHIKLLHEYKPGVSYARNKGIEEARGRYICFIDDDGYADTHWLRNVMNAFQSVTPTPAVVGGKILPYYNSEKPIWFDDQFEIRTKGEKARFLSRKECLSGFPESNFCIRKDILDEVGNFSTDFGPKGEKMIFGEGSELSARITKNHPYFWYDPNAFNYHLVRKRNMSISYILSRKYQTAYLYQKLRTPYNNIFENGFVFSTCLIRILMNAFLSLILVRWYSDKRVSDWLRQITPLVNCTARSIFILEYYFVIKIFRRSGRLHLSL